MLIGGIGLGRMGASMTARLLRRNHECVDQDSRPEAMAPLMALGGLGTTSLQGLVAAPAPPRAVWVMLPAAAVDDLAPLVPSLQPGDVVVDGGNSCYHDDDDLRRAAALRESATQHVDVGTSGGVAGLERGGCLMSGGEDAAVQQLAPVLATLAPGPGTSAATPGWSADAGTADQGWLHCGPHGAGHIVKMVDNEIEYGVMAAYAEALNILRGAHVGKRASVVHAPTTPLRHRELYQYNMNLLEIAEVWRRSSVIGSWLLDLTAAALAADPALTDFQGRVSDSGEGRWTIQAAIDEAVPMPVLSTARALCASQFARRSRFRQPLAVGDATRIRRPRRKAGPESVVEGPT